MTDDADTDLPELSAADETFVRDLLATLPPVPVPDDLASPAGRRPARSTPTQAERTADAAAVPTGAGRRRHGRRTGRRQGALALAPGPGPRRSPRSACWSVAGVLGVVKVAGSGSVAQTSTGTAGAAASPQVDSSLMTRSGHAYSDATLVNDVRLLAAHEPLPASPGSASSGD